MKPTLSGNASPGAEATQLLERIYGESAWRAGLTNDWLRDICACNMDDFDLLSLGLFSRSIACRLLCFSLLVRHCIAIVDCAVVGKLRPTEGILENVRSPQWFLRSSPDNFCDREQRTRMHRYASNKPGTFFWFVELNDFTRNTLPPRTAYRILAVLKTTTSKLDT